MTAGCPKPDVSDEAIRSLFLSHEAAEDQRTFGGPQSDLHQLLDIRPPEDDPPSGDYYLDYANFVISGPPMEALDVVLRTCDRAPDDDALCWIGVVLVEPLLDTHWKMISLRFEAEARKRRALRVAYSCAWTHLPRQARPWEERMRNLMTRDDAHPPQGVDG